MVYTTHLWWLGGWFIIALPTLVDYGSKQNTIVLSPEAFCARQSRFQAWMYSPLHVPRVKPLRIISSCGNARINLAIRVMPWHTMKMFVQKRCGQMWPVAQFELSLWSSAVSNSGTQPSTQQPQQPGAQECNTCNTCNSTGGPRRSCAFSHRTMSRLRMLSWPRPCRPPMKGKIHVSQTLAWNGRGS